MLDNLNKSGGEIFMSLCERCGGETNDFLCSHCQRSYRGVLNDLYHALRDLQQVAKKQLHVEGRVEGASTKAFPPVPVDLNAWDLLDEADDICQQVASDSGLYSHNLFSLLKTMIVNHRLLTASAHAARNLRELERLLYRVHSLTEPAGDRIIVGRCLNTVCTLELVAPRSALEVTCPACGSRWSVDAVKQARLRALVALPGAQGTAAQCARLFTDAGLHLKRHTVTMWYQRGLITPVGVTGVGYPEFAYEDIWRIVRRVA